MNKKMMLLPKLAFTNIRKNGSTYLPYIGVSIFAMFAYFVFDLILKNDIMYTLPKAMYAMVLVSMGFGLLGFIMVPFLYYTNSFLIKRRKKELGLYNILGLEKKHIGMMMLIETAGIYVVVVAAAIGIGLLFSKLIFLCLVNLAGLPVNIQFTIDPRAILDTVLFYAFVSLLNLAVNLFQVGSSNQIELLGGSKKGEKEPKHILFFSLLGFLFLGYGYYMAATAAMDDMILIAFFFAVICVVVGTYFLFTSGSIALLRSMKKNKKLYYRPDHFITVSGMLYRMKKNAAGLSNICIFSTMVIVTVICTISLHLGMPSLISFMFPREFGIYFTGAERMEREELAALVEKAATENSVQAVNMVDYEYCRLGLTLDGNSLRQRLEEDDAAEMYAVRLMVLEDYNRLMGEQEELNASQALVYSTGKDFGYDTLLLGEEELQVKQELQSFSIAPKSENNVYGAYYVVILPDWDQVTEVAARFGVDAVQSTSLACIFDGEGDSAGKDAMYETIVQALSESPGLEVIDDCREQMQDVQGMYGGLLFIGIFFGLIFLICLLVIVYYKQITEGFEDQQSFEIMQKVGMSNEEIRGTIKQQILLVFFLPLFGAVCHTVAAMLMVIPIMSIIGMYRTDIIVGSAVGTILVFSVLYCICYRCTAGVYYRIVRWMK